MPVTIKLIYNGEIIKHTVTTTIYRSKEILTDWKKLYPKNKFDNCIVIIEQSAGEMLDFFNSRSTLIKNNQE